MMNKAYVETMGAIFFIIFGLGFVIFHKIFGRWAAEFQYKFFHLRFNETIYQIGYLIVGIIFIILGVLTLFRVI